MSIILDDYRTNPHFLAGDVSSLAVTIGSLMNYLPAVAAVFSIIYLSLRIWADPTVQCLLRKRLCRQAGRGKRKTK